MFRNGSRTPSESTCSSPTSSWMMATVFSFFLFAQLSTPHVSLHLLHTVYIFASSTWKIYAQTKHKFGSIRIWETWRWFEIKQPTYEQPIRDTKYGNRKANNCFVFYFVWNFSCDSANIAPVVGVWILEICKLPKFYNTKTHTHYIINYYLCHINMINAYSHAYMHAIMINVAKHFYLNNTVCNIQTNWKRATRGTATENMTFWMTRNFSRRPINKFRFVFFLPGRINGSCNSLVSVCVGKTKNKTNTSCCRWTHSGRYSIKRRKIEIVLMTVYSPMGMLECLILRED